MTMTVADFVGTYYVKETDNTVKDKPVSGDLSRGDQIVITTKEDDLSTAYVTITKQGGETLIDEAVFIPAPEFGCLRGDTLPLEAHVMLISRYEEQTTEKLYKAIYGAIIKKDPDSVGAWGADDTPPPPS